MTDAPPLPPVQKRRPGCLVKGCGCLVGGPVLILAGLLAIGYFAEEGETREQEKVEQAERDRLEAAEAKVKDFASQQAPELYASVQELEQLELDLGQRINELRTEITSLGRDPSEDADYLRWEEDLADVRKARASLREELEAAYLAYRKFQLQPQGADSAELRQTLESGRASALDVQDRYRGLRERLQTQ